MKPFQQIFGPWGGAIRRQMAKEVNKHISTQSSNTNHSQKRGQGKGWARTQMQVLRDCSHIPTAATKADSCSKQNQIKKTLAKRQHQTKELVPISLYVLLRPSPLIIFFKTSRCIGLESHLCTTVSIRSRVTPSFPLQSSPHLWRIFPPPSHVLWPSCSSTDIRIFRICAS